MIVTLADTGSEISWWVVAVLIGLVVLGRLALTIREIRRTPAGSDPQGVTRHCSHLSCPYPPVVEVHDFPLCRGHIPPKENPPMEPVVNVAPDGDSASIRRADLPTVANVQHFTTRLSFEQVEDLYVLMRSRRLGVGGNGEL